MKLWNKKQRLALGLSEKEGVLLDTLHRLDECNTSVLAYESLLPRVTVMRMLKILSERGFVSRREIGREVVWVCTPQKEIENRYSTLFDNAGKILNHNIPLSEVGALTIYRGVEGMIKSNERMLIAHAGERVLAIEPNGIWKHVATVDSSDMHDLNLLWKEKKILVEMITEEGFENVIANQIKTELGTSFLALATDIRIVPKGMLDSATEILIFRDQVLFTDWAHLVGVEIKNPSTVRVMKAMFRMLQKSGREYVL